MGFFVAVQEVAFYGREVSVTAKKMNPKHRAFAEAYLSNGGNALQAALTAGYSESTAKSRSYELLRDERVTAYIASRRKELAAQAVTPERVLLELADIGFGQRDFPAYDMYGTEHQRKPSMTARLKALELMGKNLGMYTDKLNVDTTDTGQLEGILAQLKGNKDG